MPLAISVSLTVAEAYANIGSSIVAGRGGALVESMPFDRRVAGSIPALAAT